MLDGDASRNALINALAADLERYSIGNIKEFGSEFDRLDDEIPRTIADANFWIAFNFWEAWIDQMNHGFRQLFYDIPREDWPTFCEHILEALRSGKEITDWTVLDRFDSRQDPPAPPSLKERLYHWLNDTREEMT
jgi:hypothetical protein